MQVSWLSVDPLRRKIDFYPYNIALRIEKAYKEQNETSQYKCVLGSDFFNSTIHFNANGSCYQTTPGVLMGRAGYKQPGHRSVLRVYKPSDNNNIIVHCQYVSGELRIIEKKPNIDINIDRDVDETFNEIIPSECLIDIETIDKNEITDFKPWTNDDLSNESLSDVSVVVWQWCNALPEYQGNLIALTENWWRPYMSNQNMIIEEAFANDSKSVNITIPDCGIYTIKFTPGQMFGSQNNYVDRKHRVVRRVIKTVNELKNIFLNIPPLPVNISKLINTLPDGTVPDEFLCCITQDIMRDPVKTIDGHTYDKPGILRWFETNSTSPLTGLPLPSKSLTPDKALYDKIEKFIDDILADKK